MSRGCSLRTVLLRLKLQSTEPDQEGATRQGQQPHGALDRRELWRGADISVATPPYEFMPALPETLELGRMS